MRADEYSKPRKLPRHLRPAVEPEVFAYSIRDATEKDLPSVREIYNYYVTNSSVTFDEKTWSLKQWKEKYAHLRKIGLPFIVAQSPTGQLLGYALLGQWKPKSAYRYTTENSIYLGPSASGRGLGRALLTELIVRAEDAGIRQILAVISDKGAEASIALHEKLGFEEVGRMGKVGFKFGRWLGTVILQKEIPKKKRRKAAES